MHILLLYTYFQRQQRCLTLIKCSDPCCIVRWAYLFQCLKHSSMKNLNMRPLWLDTESRAAGDQAPYRGSGNLLFLPALAAPFYSPGWITEGMALTGWFTDLCPSTTPLRSAKLGEHDVVHWWSASCSAHISPGKSAKDIHHPHTLTCAYRCRASSV